MKGQVHEMLEQQKMQLPKDQREQQPKKRGAMMEQPMPLPPRRRDRLRPFDFAAEIAVVHQKDCNYSGEHQTEKNPSPPQQ